MSSRAIPLLAAVLILSSCAAGVARRQHDALKQVIPFQEATMSPKPVEKDGLSAAAEIPAKSEQKSLFSRKITSEGFVPVLITVTNDSDQRYVIRSGQARLLLPDDQTAAAVGIDPIDKKIGFSYARGTCCPPQPRYINIKADQMETMRNILHLRALPSFVLEPRQSKRGFIFFANKDMKAAGKEPRVLLPVEALDKLDHTDLEVPITEND